MQAKIMASLAAADPLNLAEAIRAAESAGVDQLHLDIEDGNFVPNITFGLRMIRAVRAFTSLPLDVHLMSTVSEQLLEELRDLKVESISVHFEAVDYPLRALTLIRRCRAKAGLALNPRTPIDDVAYAIAYYDFVLLMANEPDGQGEKFLDSTYSRIAAVRRLLSTQRRDTEASIVVDGAIEAANVQAVIAAGATAVVCGRSIFGSPGITANVNAIRMASAHTA